MNTAKVIVFLLSLIVVLPAFAQDHAHAAGREPAQVMSFRGAPWLEREGREEEERPDEVIAVMDLKNGDVVCDLGVGSGFFARRMAKKVAPDGKIYGVDIQPEMLEILKDLCEKEGIENVVPVLGEAARTTLEPKSCDWILLVDVYHEFQEPEPMLADMFSILKDDGRVALLEYRLDGETAAHIKLDHRMSVAQVLAEWNPAGFELVDLKEFLPAQHFFIFKKDPDRLEVDERGN